MWCCVLSHLPACLSMCHAASCAPSLLFGLHNLQCFGARSVPSFWTCTIPLSGSNFGWTLRALSLVMYLFCARFVSTCSSQSCSFILPRLGSGYLVDFHSGAFNLQRPPSSCRPLFSPTCFVSHRSAGIHCVQCRPCRRGIK